MSRASRSATPERAVHAPRSPLSVSSASSHAPRAGEATPIAHPTADGESCCVCLGRLSPAAQGANLAVPFPACSRHFMHLECLAQYRAQASGPQDLLCPLCRHGHCPECIAGGWSGAHDALLRSLCLRHGVAMPARLSGESTVREAVRDYTLRTFTANDAPEPPPPPGVAVLCCQRLAAMGVAGGVDFVGLPHREMQWAPVPIRHGSAAMTCALSMIV